MSNDMQRLISTTLLLLLFVCVVSAAQPPEHVSYYLGEVKMTSPGGQPYGSSVSLVKRTMKPAENRIVELVLSVDGRGPAQEYNTVFTVNGSKFELREAGGGFSGGGDLMGPAWGWTGWSYKVTMGGRMPGTVTAEDTFQGENLVAHKTFAGPDGKAQVLFIEELKPISGEMYELLHTRLMGK